MATKLNMRRGLWSPEEDSILVDYVTNQGVKYWSAVPLETGLQRCGKSCRLRWTNYLRPSLCKDPFSEEEKTKIAELHSLLGNRWAVIAAVLPGRTDNDVKNFWYSSRRKARSTKTTNNNSKAKADPGGCSSFSGTWSDASSSSSSSELDRLLTDLDGETRNSVEFWQECHKFASSYS